MRVATSEYDYLVDIILNGNQVDNKLFINQDNLKFKESPKVFGEKDKFWSIGAIPIDESTPERKKIKNVFLAIFASFSIP